MSAVAVVTGASRGVGRGVAAALSDAGFAVFATGRTIERADLPANVARIPCDHLNDQQTDDAFERVKAEGGRIDVLVNSAWGGYERMIEDGVFTWTKPFYEQPIHRWTSMMDAGARAAFVCSQHAASVMVRQRRGLIVNISYIGRRGKYMGNAIYGIAKAAADKMTADTAHELREHGVAVVSLYPGLVRTEAVLETAKQGWLDISNSESPEFSGRVIAALYGDPELMSYSGRVVVGAEMAMRYGITDIDGRQPAPLTIEAV